MRNRRTLAVAGFVLMAVAACGGAEPPVDEAEAKAKGRDTDATVFDDMIQTQDRARGVEATTMAAKDAMDAAIDQQAEDGSQNESE
jgi:hypothetical protein